MFTYFIKDKPSDDIHHDYKYINATREIVHCINNHNKKTGWCSNKITTVHPVTKSPFKRLCMAPCTPNWTGMCEQCNPEWKEPITGCAYDGCRGPYILGKEGEYRDNMKITMPKNCTIYSSSLLNNHISSVFYD